MDNLQIVGDLMFECLWRLNRDNVIWKIIPNINNDVSKKYLQISWEQRLLNSL